MFIKPKLPPDASLLAKKLAYCFKPGQEVKVRTGQTLSAHVTNGEITINVQTPSNPPGQIPYMLKATLQDCFWTKGALKLANGSVLTHYPDVQGHCGLDPIVNPESGLNILVKALRAIRCEKK